MRQTTIRLDYETRSEADLKKVGLHNYAVDFSTRALMLAYSWNDGPVEHIDFANGDRMPPEVRDALTDPEVVKLAFNAQFERVITRKTLGIKTPYKNWRCTMVKAFMHSFNGGLAEIGAQLGLPQHLLKDPIGSKLIRMFCMPQNVTKNQPHRWRDATTDPEDWQRFCGYNVQDVTTEAAVDHKLPSNGLGREWELYEIDQRINDRGLPVDLRFVEGALKLSVQRKIELLSMMQEVTDLANPNSSQQFLPWLVERGYPFNDLKKLTVKKVLTEDKLRAEDDFEKLSQEVVIALKLRQQASRTSVRKYHAITQRVSDDNRLHYAFQFGGATRTFRWSGRSVQPQNLVRTPKMLESLPVLQAVVDTIREADYEMLRLLVEEPMEALAGTVRSSFDSGEDAEFAVCDLSAIESAVIAWITNCTRMLNVFGDGRDPYKDFGVDLYRVSYQEVTSLMRGICKPAVLGCGFGLGGGKLFEGKRTGLWGYAEGMGVDLSLEDAHKQVKLFRTIYPEIPAFWKECDRAMELACEGRTVNFRNMLLFKKTGDYMTVQLPSGRTMFYYKPMIKEIKFPGKPVQETYFVNDERVTRTIPGEPYYANKFTCMGMSQITKRWGRIVSGGPKLCENFVQAIARDVLSAGMHRAHKAEINIVGSVHDELITLRRRGDNRHDLAELRDCMTFKEAWMDGLPLKAAGYIGRMYRKD